MTPQARDAIENAEVIVGYKTYTNLVKSLIRPSVEVFSGIMGREVERAKFAVQKAQQGKVVAVVSSGDPGVYGMAGVVLEAASAECAKVRIEVVPGVTAATSAASKLGAPLVTDFAVISLSYLLTPWLLIEKRLHAAAQADFVIVLYNPQSLGRKKPLVRAHEILLNYRLSDTPEGVVKQVGREGETTTVTTLKDLMACEVDMFSTVIVGNSTTQVINGKMVTPRGYLLDKPQKQD
jgi:precorrin-3B C17-methyltransferase